MGYSSNKPPPLPAGVTLNTIMYDVWCKSCDVCLPPHTVAEHLDKNNPVHNCKNKFLHLLVEIRLRLVKIKLLEAT